MTVISAQVLLPGALKTLQAHDYAIERIAENLWRVSKPPRLVAGLCTTAQLVILADGLLPDWRRAMETENASAYRQTP